MLFVVDGSMAVVCCLVLAVCRLSGVRCLLCVACCMVPVVRCLFFVVVCGSLFVGGC